MKPLPFNSKSFFNGFAPLCFGVFAFFAQSVLAQLVMMPDSTNNRMVVFSEIDGSLVNANYFGLQGGTPIHGLQVGNEIWVSEQIGDRISRWSLSGSLLGNIGGAFAGGGLDNIRGMALIDNTVYVTNAGTANGAPGPSIVRFDTAGNNLGSFSTTGFSPGPFAVMGFQGGLLVASSSANDDIHRYDLSGNSIGTFHNSTTVNFAQQMALRPNGNLIVAGFSLPAGVHELDPINGSVLATYAAGLGQRGVFQLLNGNILWSNGSGAHVLDPTTNISTQVYTGVGRHFSSVAIPEPTAAISVWLLLAAAFRRNRRV